MSRWKVGLAVFCSCAAVMGLTGVCLYLNNQEIKQTNATPETTSTPQIDPHQELRQHIEWCRGMIFQQSQAIDTMAAEIREFKNTLDPMLMSPRPITTGEIVWVEAARLVNGNPIWDQLVTEAGGMFMYKDSESYRKWVHPATEAQP